MLVNISRRILARILANKKNDIIRICICFPEKTYFEGDTFSTEEDWGMLRRYIREDLPVALKVFYGKFSGSRIEFFYKIYRDNKLHIYVIGDTLIKSHDGDILETITSVVGNYVDNEIIINLHYHMIDPNFTPTPEIEQNASDDTSSKKSSNPKQAEILQRYPAVESDVSWANAIFSNEVREQIEEAIAILDVQDTVFEVWNLKKVATPTVAINLWGEPGTGKTLVAKATANRFGKKIISTSYSDIDSELVSVGSRNVQDLFQAAALQDAILFIDEADSLLSKRINATSSASQGANALRSEILIQMEKFRGLVIFATNIYKGYDEAFVSRLISIEVKMPAYEERKAIWDLHLGISDRITMNIPLSDDVNTEELAARYDKFSGRSIRNVVKDACITVAIRNKNNKTKNPVSQADLLKACEKMHEMLAKKKSLANHPLLQYSEQVLPYEQEHVELSPQAEDELKSIFRERTKEKNVSAK